LQTDLPIVFVEITPRLSLQALAEYGLLSVITNDIITSAGCTAQIFWPSWVEIIPPLTVQAFSAIGSLGSIQ